MEVQNVEKIGKFNTVMYVFMAVTVGMMVANYWPILGGLGGQVSFKSTPVEQRLYAMLNFFAWSIYLLLIALVVLAGIIAWKMFDAEEAKEKKILAGRLEGKTNFGNLPCFFGRPFCVAEKDTCKGMVVFEVRFVSRTCLIRDRGWGLINP